jgi:hypothetical protein
MVDIQTVSIAIASASVVAGVIYYALQLRHQTKIRQTDLVMRLYSTFGGEDHQRAGLRVSKISYEGYDDFVKKYGAPNSEEPVPIAIHKVLCFFEEVGVLLHKKLIDIDLIDQLFGYNIIMIGTTTMPVIEQARKRLNQPRIWTNFGYLYDEVKKREQQP